MKTFLKSFGIALLLMIMISVAATSCTENARVKRFGGEATVHLAAGQEFVNATWKNSDLWIVTRKRREGETLDKFTFAEKSSFGIAEGTYTFVEH